MYDTVQGVLCRTLEGHGHWVNTMALSTNYALKTGAFDPSNENLQRSGIRGLSREDMTCGVVAVVIESFCG